jgi:hypothetical protein
MKISKFFACIFLMFVSNFCTAQSQTTNNPNLVLKDLECVGIPISNLNGLLVNRATTSSEGMINLKVIDNDGDVIYQTNESYRVKAQDGYSLSFALGVAFCAKPYKYSLTIKECQLPKLSFFATSCEK